MENRRFPKHEEGEQVEFQAKEGQDHETQLLARLEKLCCCCHCVSTLKKRRMASEMLRLGYVIIGCGDGEGFPMDVETSASVSELMKRLKVEHGDLISCAPTDLKLFLGKKSDLEWLQDDDKDVSSLSSGEEAVVVKHTTTDLEMRPTESLDSYFADVKSKNGKQSATIHVVVQLPPSSVKPEPIKAERESRAIDALIMSRPLICKWRSMYAMNICTTKNQSAQTFLGLFGFRSQLNCSKKTGIWGIHVPICC